MLSLRNQVTIVGNMYNDAQITTFGNGSTVARFSVGTEHKTASGKNGKRIAWYRMFAWGNTAAFIQRYCDKGETMAFTGRLVSRTYVDPQGEARKVTEIEVRHVVKLVR